MTAIKGAPPSDKKPELSSVHDSVVSPQKEHRCYAVYVKVRVFANSPAEAAVLMQSTLIGVTPMRSTCRNPDRPGAPCGSAQGTAQCARHGPVDVWLTRSCVRSTGPCTSVR